MAFPGLHHSPTPFVEILGINSGPLPCHLESFGAAIGEETISFGFWRAFLKEDNAEEENVWYSTGGVGKKGRTEIHW